MALQSVDEVNCLIVLHLNPAVGDDFARTAGNIIFARSRNTCSMRLNVVEVVACHKLANHFVAAETESETGFVAHSASVEHLLLAAPSRRQSVAYARILIEVESLLFLIVHDLRRGKAMEIVYDEHRLAGSRIIEHREGFGGETFSSCINRSHLKMVKLARFQLHLAAGGVHDGSVVKTALSLSLIDNVRSRAGRWFRLVQLGSP